MDRGFLSQNILSQLRNFVEYIAIKVYGNGQDIDPNNYDLRKAALHDMKKQWELRFPLRSIGHSHNCSANPQMCTSGRFVSMPENCNNEGDILLRFREEGTMEKVVQVIPARKAERR